MTLPGAGAIAIPSRMLLAMKPAHKMRPAFPAFPSPRGGATPFDADLAELVCQRPTAFALGEHGVGRLPARAVYDKFLRGGDEDRGEESRKECRHPLSVSLRIASPSQGLV